jgi:hypothetical protein
MYLTYTRSYQYDHAKALGICNLSSEAYKCNECNEVSNEVEIQVEHLSWRLREICVSLLQRMRCRPESWPMKAGNVSQSSGGFKIELK